MLHLVPTPIGNLEDMTYRAVRILQEADLIAAEDTRTSKKLLDHYDIKTPITSYHEHNKIEKAQSLLEKLREGARVALITDAGTPGISDPGEELVAMCYEEGLEVEALPGACAAITAAVSSGQHTRRLAFEAFLPKDKKERHRVLDELADETRTIILYEAPHHLKATLKELTGVLGEDRPVTLCRELTKLHEEKIRTTLGKAGSLYEENEPRGEYVLVIAGKSKAAAKEEQLARWEDVPLQEHLDRYLADGYDKKEAMKLMAADRGVSKREIYQALLNA